MAQRPNQSWLLHAARPGPWMAGALLQSGQTDPTWALSAEAGSALAARFAQFDPWLSGRPHQPRIGYCGAWLLAPDGQCWIAFQGVVWRDGTMDARRDADRAFESALLATALPSALLGRLRDTILAAPFRDVQFE